jgi:Flp pilus assembly CpaE family ATPase
MLTRFARAQPPDPLMAELDRLEELLAQRAEPDAAVSARLRTIVSRWGGVGAPTAASLADATSDDLFAFIDNQLGRATS